MARARIGKIVRQFPQNSMKLLLEHPRTVRGLLCLARTALVKRIDFSRMRRDPTTYVVRDYHHMEADIVLRAPLKTRKRRRSGRTIWIYILIEHQSEPDPLMPFRVLEYVVMIYKAQLREWARTHDTFTGFRFQPVLPIVFYTGTRRWESVGRLVDLVDLGKLVQDRIPELEPLFLNLSDLSAQQLEEEGGFFGWVLRLLQQRDASPDEFDELLKRVLQHLESMPEQDRLRWQEFLSYVHAMVYHEREQDEHADLQATIEKSLAQDKHREKVMAVKRTIAMWLEEKGVKKGEVRALRRTLLHQLRERFGELPEEVIGTIKGTSRVRQLEKWLNLVLSAKTLDELEIASTK